MFIARKISIVCKEYGELKDKYDSLSYILIDLETKFPHNLNSADSLGTGDKHFPRRSVKMNSNELSNRDCDV